MKIILFALILYSCLSCGTLPRPVPEKEVAGQYGILCSGRRTDLEAVMPVLQRANWKRERQSFTVWKVSRQVTLMNGKVLEIPTGTAAFRIRGESGEFYVQKKDVAKFMSFSGGL